MALNLLNDYALNDFLTDISFQGNPQLASQGIRGEFESVDYVVAHRDTIARGILNQYVKRKIRDYILNLKNEPAFVAVDATQPDLPDWTKGVFARGEQVYLFNGAKMSDKLKNDITTVRDYLYDVALMYVDKVVKTAEATKQKPKIRYDYLKTTNEYNTFEQALSAAHKWHEKLAQNLEQKLKAQEILKKSQVGARFVMALPDGMSAYQLTTAEALDFESEYMGHCVGKGGYDKGVKDGTTQIYSIRDERGEPHVTFEVRDGVIQQCKGKQNKVPIEKYMPAVQAFIKQNKFKLGGDKRNTGLIEQDGEYYNLFHLPRGFVLRGDLDLSYMDLTELPDMSTVTILGNFYCNHNQLTSLTGAPKRVGGIFECSRNQLTSLDGAPEKVDGFFDCSYNQLTSLAGAPKEVGGDFFCFDNQLTSLVGAPKDVGKCFDCSVNFLRTLDGAPEKIGEDFNCRVNQLTSLKGAPKEVGGNFNCTLNQLTTLKGAPKEVGGNFYCSSNKLGALEGAPEKVGEDFICLSNQLTTLKGAPKEVGGNFNCSLNQLITLANAPEKVGMDFRCSSNQLTSLKGAPKEVNGDFDSAYNQLMSLDGAPNKVGGTFDCSSNQLTTLKDAPNEVGCDFNCSHNQLTSLECAPKKIGGKIYSIGNPLKSEKSKADIFKQGIKNIPPKDEKQPVMRTDDDYQI